MSVIPMTTKSFRPDRTLRMRALVGVLCLSATALWGAVDVRAQDMALPLADQWRLYDNIMSFDRLFEDRAEDGIVVGVLYQSRYRPSARVREDLEQMDEDGVLNLAGRKVRLVPIEFTTARELERRLVETEADVLYIAPLRGAAMQELTALSDEYDVCTLTGVPDYVRLGIAVGLGLRGERPEILVNLGSSRDQGMDLSSQLLRIATVFSESF